MRAMILALVLPLPALAQPMTGAEFDAYTAGRTLTYNSGGQAYGIEQYLKNRHVRWAFLGDDCVDGTWYEDNGQICFTYENDGTPQCWTFEKGSAGLIARFQNDPAVTELYETRQSDKPMLCLGPKVGV